jgi:hypothetical protein
MKTIDVLLTTMLVLAAGSSLAAQSQDDSWIFLETLKDDSKAYRERTYEELPNGNRVVRVKIEDRDGTKHMYSYEFDCASGKRQLGASANYDKEWHVIKRFPPVGVWAPVAPDTIFEDIYRQVCRGWAQPLGTRPQQRAEPPDEPRRPADLDRSLETGDARPDPGVDYVVVTASRANLREDSNITSASLLTLVKGHVLVLLDPSPVGSWYNVIDVETNQEGWIHQSTIAINHTLKPRPLITLPESETGSYGTPYVEVTNDSAKKMTLKIGGSRYVLSPGEIKTIYVSPGTYKFHASAPGVIPDFGEDLFKAGYRYRWRFYITPN